MNAASTPSGLYWLSRDDIGFPDVALALDEPNGLLAVGGDLSPARLLNAYRHGIFPWFSAGQPILWWSPDPRAVLYPQRLRIARSLRKTLRSGRYAVSLDRAFAAVIAQCAQPRADGNGTWITAAMQQAYCRLHALGYAHSVECWQEGELIGGLYGVALGRVFFGESMFSRRRDASKVALAHLVEQLRRWDFALIDCQLPSAHLASLGAEQIPRTDFVAALDHHCAAATRSGIWRMDPDIARSFD